MTLCAPKKGTSSIGRTLQSSRGLGCTTKICDRVARCTPPMFPDLMCKEVLGANHLTLTVACFDTSFTRPDGTQYVKSEEDTDLQSVCSDGHWYYERS